MLGLLNKLDDNPEAEVVEGAAVVAVLVFEGAVEAPPRENNPLTGAVVEGAAEVPPREENSPPAEAAVEAVAGAGVEVPELVDWPKKLKPPGAWVGVGPAFSIVGCDLGGGKLKAGLGALSADDEVDWEIEECPPRLGKRLGFVAFP